MLQRHCLQCMMVARRRFSDQSSLTFRDAVASDKTAVLTLRQNVYRGLDYLPDYWDHFLGDINRRCIVGQLGSQIVVFGVMLTLDGGGTVLGQAGRVHERHEGKGYFSALNQYVNAVAMETGCQRRVALVEITLNKYARSEKFRKMHVQIASKLHYAGLVNEEHRQEMTSNMDRNTDAMSDDLEQVTTSILDAYFNSPTIRQALFPKGRILLDYVPYRSITENTSYLNGRNTVFFSDVIVTGSDVTGLMSAGTVYKCQNPPESYTIDIFGSDVDSLERHVMFHIRRALGVTSGPFCLQLFVESGYVAQMLCKILIQHDVQKCHWYVEGGVSTKAIVEEPFDRSDTKKVLR